VEQTSQQYLKLTYKVVFGDSDMLVTALRNRTLDVVITRAIIARPLPDLNAEVLFHDRIVVVASATHPLMLELATHIVNQKAGHFEPDKFEGQYETALIDLINQKRAGKPIVAKDRPRGENVVDLLDALRKSVGGGGEAA
jgi:DNA-binding transcriptional LysR family regulator